MPRRSWGVRVARPMNADQPAAELDDSLSAYGAAYRRRQQQRQRGAFDAREPNALLALFWTRYAASRGDESLVSTTAHVQDLLSEVFADEAQHDVGVDIAGLVSAASFGVLAMADPPSRAVELAFQSGRSTGAVRGLYGVAWRAYFLATAWRYFDWRQRPRVSAELQRRHAYLVERVTRETGHLRGLNLSQLSRVLMLVSEIAVLLSDDDMLSHASAHMAELVSLQRDDGSLPSAPGERAAPTAHLAQFSLAAHTAGQIDSSQKALAYIARERMDSARHLLTVADDAPRAEMSPWVPLALLTALDRHESASPTEPQVEQLEARGVHRWLRRGPRDRG